MREGIVGREVYTGVSYPALTNDYAHTKDGCLAIDQLHSVMLLVPKKARANAPSNRLPHEEYHQGMILFISSFCQTSPRPSSATLSTRRLALPHHVEMVKKNFPTSRYVLPLHSPLSLSRSLLLPPRFCTKTQRGKCELLTFQQYSFNQSYNKFNTVPFFYGNIYTCSYK